MRSLIITLLTSENQTFNWMLYHFANYKKMQ